MKKKQDRNLLIFIIVFGVVIAAFIVGSLINRSGILKNNKSAITIDGTKYTLSEFNYYYYAYYNAYIDENSQYLSYMFDQSQSLKTQEYDKEQSWFDFFVGEAKDSMIHVIEAAKEAKKEGYTLSEDAKIQIKNTLASIEDAADLAGISQNQYLENVYGQGMTEELYRKHLEYSYMASEYGDFRKQSYTFSDDEISKYYNENSRKYTFVNYERFYVKASDVDSEPTEDEKKKAYDIAQKILERVHGGESLKTVSEDFKDTGTYYTFDDAYYDASFSYGEWLFAQERKEGDSNIIDDGSGYYVMVFHSRNTGDYKSADVIDLCFQVEEQTNQEYEDSCSKAEEIKGLFEDTDKTKESFLEIVSEYEANEFLDLTRNTLDSALDAWIFDESRKPKDCDVIYTSNGFHVIYYIQEGQEAWKIEAENDLRDETYSKWYQEIVKNVAVSENEDVLGTAGGEKE